MTGLYDFAHWLTQTYFGSSMRTNEYLFPSVEALHIMGTAILVASTSVLSLRLAGLFWTDAPVSKIASQFLPWAWIGFSVQVVTGTLLFMSEATLAYSNVIFIVKMSLVFLAGVNAVIFHQTVYRRVKTWDIGSVPPAGAKFVGYASLVIWFAVVAAGRWLNTSVAQSVVPK
jgi:hypothetical protein